jgi:hypothetical protein
MLGYYLAELVAEETGASDELNVFLRWEQLAAYARGGANNDWGFRGTERTKKNWGESDRIRLATDSVSLILSDQKTYGLWGLYSVPARSSGLIEGNPARLTAEARKFVEENYWPVLAGKALSRGEGLVKLLAKRSVELRPKDRDSAVFDAVAKVLRRKLSSPERFFYLGCLVKGGPQDATHGGQRILAEAMRTTFDVDDWRLSATAINHLAKKCRTEAGETGRQVASFLDEIRTAELLLAPSSSLFAFLLSNDGQRLDSVAARVRKQWGPSIHSVAPKALAAFDRDLVDGSGEAASALRWLAVAEALTTGDYAGVVRKLLDQNRVVMEMRGGAAPWADVRDGKLHVRFVAEDAGSLPSKAELPSHWIHSYFLDSLRGVTMQLEA